MRLLVLGGTRFLSHAVATEAVTRGHTVTCAARGESGQVPTGAHLVKVDRDADDGLDALTGDFDAVVDVARISFPWVRRAVDTLAGRVGHWTFVSSISVYAEPDKINDELLPPRETEDDMESYGHIKVASENAVREAFPDAFIARAGLLTGPGDLSDRFGYWPARMSQGGQVVTPDADQLTGYLDVRDAATWLVDAAETQLKGTFDVTGPAVPLSNLLREMAAGFDVELVPVAEDVLVKHGVQAWMGPKSLPLWLPESHRLMASRDAGPALAAGLKPRPLADAVEGALAHERAMGLDRERKAGLTAAEEAAVLAAL
ncbi:NAD-dependent epimerase/dehydratase [Alloactinosynnema sp. L-07]|uniref:NAD-dependent epimerase/dehydratase family protein n=1 Tax=Alloactinosynnema sp. L-07 TaxID=1653480 RepID=UPI00065EF5AB|nr:NAD-dependent epimerase/dehydratase family protein [Alloactinosynnema sp. L-07]CRK60448.1 NAD-dependent epimerase/dehydratase [Alloactinosynnema sp. L-07]